MSSCRRAAKRSAGMCEYYYSQFEGHHDGCGSGQYACVRPYSALFTHNESSPTLCRVKLSLGSYTSQVCRLICPKVGTYISSVRRERAACLSRCAPSCATVVLVTKEQFQRQPKPSLTHLLRNRFSFFFTFCRFAGSALVWVALHNTRCSRQVGAVEAT
jgi:hypothetical protein